MHTSQPIIWNHSFNRGMDGNGYILIHPVKEKPEKYAYSFDVDAVSEPFPGPTLIVTDRQDSIAGYRDAWKILDNYPRATYVVLDRAGHMLEETEDLVHVLINDWLDRVEENIGLV